MKILVTGGAGYIGSILTGFLLEAGHEVAVLDTFEHGENSLSHLCHRNGLTIVRGDVRDLSALVPLVRSHDVIIPLAAIVGAPACERDQTAATSVNLWSIRQLCKLVSNDQLILFPNTNSGYGTTGTEPCTEDTPLRPLSLYADTKAEAEKVIMQRENSVTFRLATVFGASPRMRMDLLVNDFVYRALRDGSLVLFEPHARRNYVSVRDVARAFGHALQCWERMRGKVFNCGNTEANCTKADLVQQIGRHVEGLTIFKGPGGDKDKRDYKVSNARLEATGWRPVWSLDDGIIELIKLYQGLRPARYVNA